MNFWHWMHPYTANTTVAGLIQMEVTARMQRHYMGPLITLLILLL